MINYEIKHRDAPFDGVCQSCTVASADIAVPVRLDYVQREEMASYDSEGTVRTCFVPCFFCHGCHRQFRWSLWTGLAWLIPSLLIDSVWLVFALIASVIVTVILPLVGFGFVIIVLFGLFAQLGRKRCNPNLLKHLDKVCSLKATTEQFYLFRLRVLPAKLIE